MMAGFAGVSVSDIAMMEYRIHHKPENTSLAHQHMHFQKLIRFTWHSPIFRNNAGW
jgi:hypothetical protein